MTSDLLFTFISLLTIAIGGFYIWMRTELESRGRSYPLLNSSFKIYVDFMEAARYDSKLKKKKNQVLLTLSISWIALCIIISIYSV